MNPVNRLCQYILAKKRTLTLVVFAVLAMFSGGLWALQSTSAQRAAEQKRQAQTAKTERIEQDLAEAAKKKQKEQKQKQEKLEKTSEQTAATPPAASAPAAQPKKYSTSSDPRSTAYSTTPPAPNPASFETKITHNGQVAAGTLISYNATKNEKAYYGGDLILSAYSITLSKSNAAAYPNTVTVTVPDGAEVRMPSTPWDYRDPVGIAMEASQYKNTGTTFNMIVTTWGGATGTYQLHINTNRTGQGADAWYYHAFITVNIVN